MMELAGTMIFILFYFIFLQKDFKLLRKMVPEVKLNVFQAGTRSPPFLPRLDQVLDRWDEFSTFGDGTVFSLIWLMDKKMVIWGL